jgi:hypothetical protein
MREDAVRRCENCQFRDTGFNTGYEPNYCHGEGDIVDPLGYCDFHEPLKPTKPPTPTPGAEGREKVEK